MKSSPLSEFSNKVMQRDGGKCTKCGSRRMVVAHHIKHESKVRSLLDNSISNGITLCRPCHAKVHADERAGQSIENLTVYRKRFITDLPPDLYEWVMSQPQPRNGIIRRAVEILKTIKEDEGDFCEMVEFGRANVNDGRQGDYGEEAE